MFGSHWMLLDIIVFHHFSNHPWLIFVPKAKMQSLSSWSSSSSSWSSSSWASSSSSSWPSSSSSSSSWSWDSSVKQISGLPTAVHYRGTSFCPTSSYIMGKQIRTAVEQIKKSAKIKKTLKIQISTEFAEGALGKED